MGNTKKTITIRLIIAANKAAPSPILSQALGQHRINIIAFRKDFNERTKNWGDHVLIPTKIHVSGPSLYHVTIKTPTVTYPLMKTAGINKGINGTNKNALEKQYVLVEEIYHIAALKKCDPSTDHVSLRAMCRTIRASANSMGLPITQVPWQERSKQTL